MPLYSMKCQVCEATCTTKLTFAEYDEVKAGTRTLTCGIPDCGGWAAIEFNPGDVNFVLKDGEHGGWNLEGGQGECLPQEAHPCGRAASAGPCSKDDPPAELRGQAHGLVEGRS